jgi:hypothetical protein
MLPVGLLLSWHTQHLQSLEWGKATDSWKPLSIGLSQQGEGGGHHLRQTRKRAEGLWGRAWNFQQQGACVSGNGPWCPLVAHWSDDRQCASGRAYCQVSLSLAGALWQVAGVSWRRSQRLCELPWCQRRLSCEVHDQGTVPTVSVWQVQVSTEYSRVERREDGVLISARIEANIWGKF